MQKTVLSRTEIESNFDSLEKWQQVIFSDFLGVMLNDKRPFPCVFGVNGIKRDEVRFIFLDKIVAEPLVDPLSSFIENSREYGKNTSLIVLEKPTEVQSIAAYRYRFWSLLNELVKLDPKKWPNDIPKEMDNKYWEFCFNGEPLFVVCNTPAHIHRISRKSTSFMITLQPRWIFDELFETKAKADNAFNTVTKRLEPYDIVSKSEVLGQYGTDNIFEWKQYFLENENHVDLTPPYAKLGE